MTARKTISAIHSLRKRRPQDAILKYSSSLEDITENKGDVICILRSKGLTKKEIAKKIHKSDRYVAAVLKNYVRAIGLPKIMTKSAKKYLLKFRRSTKRISKKR